MDEKICIGCKYSDNYGFPTFTSGEWKQPLKCPVLNPYAPKACESISACPFVPSNGKDPAYIDLMRTIRMGLVKYLNMANGLWDEMVLRDDDMAGQYALGEEIPALENYERELTVRLIRVMRREEKKKNHE